MPEKYFLSVMSIFRNEAHVLKEWLDHYLAEGVNHFYLIDNDSTDNWEEILVPYIGKGQITLFREKRRHYQEKAYNEHIFPIKDQTEWMIVCDLDEFIYGKKDSIADFIGGLPHIVNGVRLPWILFGSSGHVAQPRSVVDGFRKRRRYPKGGIEVAKNIVRTRDVMRFGIHVHTINGWVVFDGCCRSVKNETSGEQDEDYIRDAALLLNHYRIQSWDWYRQTKMTRGVALDNPDAAFRLEGYKVDEKYFTDNDFDDVVDDTLATKRGFPSSSVHQVGELDA
jgi:hypothetical protein